MWYPLWECETIPEIVDQSPDDKALVTTRTPTLIAWARAVGGTPPIRYTFNVCETSTMTGATCFTSGQLANNVNTWTIPAGKLEWGKEYWWTVQAKDATSQQTDSAPARSFTTGVHQPGIASLLSKGEGDLEFHPAVGNYTTTVTDVSVAAVGPALAVVRSYNAMDPEQGRLFGAGWTTRWDMKIQAEPHPTDETLLVTYPDGRKFRFADNGDGTFQPPPGMHATLGTVAGGGWRLKDKAGTSYFFDAQGRLTRIADNRDRGQDLVYDGSGRLAQVIATGGRSLIFTWSGDHVASVSTDAVNGTPLTWTYQYDGDKLTQVCSPVAVPNCTTYTYTSGSLYRSVVLNSQPTDYWPLGEASGSTAANLGFTAKNAYYTSVSYGKPGALAGSTDTAVEFGSGRRLSLPDHAIPRLGDHASVELWFKTTGSGVLLAADGNNVSGLPRKLMLYVGTDGKLRGSFTASGTPITSAGTVNDGQWHHVVLSVEDATQRLYLDGTQVGTLSQQPTAWWSIATVGNGYSPAGTFPATPASGQNFAFAGQIDEVALYNTTLTAEEVQEHYAARLTVPHKLTKITLPSGRVWAENTYDTKTDRLTTHIDRHGGDWSISAPTYSASTGKSTVTVTEPHDGTLKYEYDAWRQYRLVKLTDQRIPSTPYTTSYEYDTGGFIAKITDRNGNVRQFTHDKRGNQLSERSCRATNNCQTSYRSYYLNENDPFDPRNDRVTAFRDARSANSTDDTYAVRYEYTAFGEKAKEILPATADFPSGRELVTTYTDGTEPAAGGGTTPAGLVKTEEDAKGNERTYTYNKHGDLVTKVERGGLEIQYGYDTIGRMISRTEVSDAHPSGVVTTFAYDGLGRLITQTEPGVENEVTEVTHTRQISYTYDPDGNKLTESVADLTGGDPTRTTTYTYDDYGRVATITDPEGGVITQTWDHTGARTSLTDKAGTLYHFTYTARGELATRILKNWTGSPVDPQSPTDKVMESYAYDPGGRLASKTDAMGRKTTYSYYGDDLLWKVTADDVKLNGSATTRDVVLEANTYDAAGNLIRQDTGGGLQRTDYVYDAANRLSSKTFDPTGLARKTEYVYDANDNVTRTTASAAGTGRTEIVEYEYNDDDKLIRQTVENGDTDLVSTLEVDDRGLVVKTVDPRGNESGATAADYTTDLRYDVAGQLVEVKAPPVQIEKAGETPTTARPTLRYGYDTVGQRTHTVDAEGRTTVSAYDKAGRVTSVTLPSYTPPGGTPLTPQTSYVYDDAGRMTQFTNPRGKVWTAEYDGLGNRVRVTDPGPSGPGGQWVYEYDLLGEQLAQVDPTGARIQATYDDLGRQITESVIERTPTTSTITTQFEYNDAGFLTKEIAPLSRTTTYTVNAAGEVTTEKDAYNKTTSYNYDLAGRLVKVTDPLGDAVVNEYDLAGRKTAIKNLNSGGSTLRTASFGYDAAGNLIEETSPEGHVTERSYDATNALIELVEPVADGQEITTTFGYDAARQKTRTTDGRGNTVWVTYNSLGLEESRIEPATTAHPDAADRTWTTIYDAAGNPVATLQPGGVRVDRQFDHLNRLVEETGSGASVATPTRSYGYDLAGRATTIGDYTLEYNDRGLLTKLSKSGTQVATYTYDALGNPLQRVDATGTATFTWDNNNRLKTVAEPVTGRTFTYGYDDDGRLTSLNSTSPVNSQTFTYDAIDRPITHTLKNSGNGQLAKITYGWDDDDNLISKTTEGTAGAGTNTYAYDRSGRLISWTDPSNNVTTYEWDAAGNRTKAGDKTFTYDERNRLISGDGTDYTYTPRGTVATETKDGVTKNLAFNAFDQLVSEGDVTYSYDALGRLISRNKAGTVENFSYSGLSNDIAVVTNGSGGVLAKYGRDPFGGLLGLQEGADPAAGVMTDQHGDVVATFSGTSLVDSFAYSPFGEVTAQIGTKRRMGYQGEYTDPDTGKVNMHARWYQPTTGGFASRDTLTVEPERSVLANRYTYANASPLTGIDPSGHLTLTDNKLYYGSSPGSIPCDSYCQAADTSDIPEYDYGCLCGYLADDDADPYGWMSLSDEEGRRIGYMPNGRPAPKDFWRVDSDIREAYMILYDIQKSEEDLAKGWKLIKEAAGWNDEDGTRVAGVSSKRNNTKVAKPPKNGDDNDWLQWFAQGGVCLQIGVVNCARAVRVTVATMRNVSDLKGKKQNAIRHFIWMAGLTIAVGPGAAWAIGEAHEAGVGEKNLDDSRIDRYNNRQGIDYALKNGSTLYGIWSSLPAGADAVALVKVLRPAGDWMYRNGKLKVA